MLEILFLRWYYGFLSKKALEKEQSRAWGMLGVALWFAGELGGFVVGFASGGTELGAYGVALVSATVGAAIAYGIVNALPDRTLEESAPLQF